MESSRNLQIGHLRFRVVKETLRVIQLKEIIEQTKRLQAEAEQRIKVAEEMIERLSKS